MAMRQLSRVRPLTPALYSSRCLLPTHPRHTRAFLGLGEIAGVLANPAETLRQLNESREMLKKAKEDMELSREAKKIPRKHTFSKLPGFHGRKTEQALLRRILSNNPKLSVIFGATSVGKTALLREVLAGDDFYVITFDLRISGFADLKTLYVALCEQFEKFFEEMHDEEMDTQKLTFKHARLALEDKLEKDGGYQVTVADIANLMESLQSALLSYWEYNPPKAQEDEEASEEAEENEGEEKGSKARKVDATKEEDNPSKDNETASNNDGEKDSEKEKNKKKRAGTFKKRPIVFLMDEAHKLPALVDNPLSLKVFLDTILVLTKQDRLCHVIFSTSDSFFHHFLRSMNVGHHAQILTIGDSTEDESKTYFVDELLQTVPKNLQTAINFKEIYDAFGGKLSHINDYVSSWINAEGQMTPYSSAIFVQAYTLLQFHLTHKKFETFSPLSTATSGTSTDDDSAQFSSKELIYVMRKMVEPPYSMAYFDLCKEIGTAKVDSMIKTRILELRWTKTVSPEEEWIERVWSEDGIERPIVLPMTRIIRKAMEVVLKEGNLPGNDGLVESAAKEEDHEHKKHKDEEHKKYKEDKDKKYKDDDGKKYKEGKK